MKTTGIFAVMLMLALSFAAGGIVVGEDPGANVDPEPLPTTTGGMSGLSNVQSAMSSLCSGLTTMLPVAAMLMVILAGVIYASGQMMGAETRARANVWATAALTGALIAILITVVAPPVLTAINGAAVKC